VAIVSSTKDGAGAAATAVVASALNAIEDELTRFRANATGTIVRVVIQNLGERGAKPPWESEDRDEINIGGTPRQQ
jgi:hypothetical protein